MCKYLVKSVLIFENVWKLSLFQDIFRENQILFSTSVSQLLILFCRRTFENLLVGETPGSSIGHLRVNHEGKESEIQSEGRGHRKYVVRNEPILPPDININAKSVEYRWLRQQKCRNRGVATRHSIKQVIIIAILL